MSEKIKHSWWSYKNYRELVFVFLLLVVIIASFFICFIYIVENRFFYIERIKVEGVELTDGIELNRFLENKKNDKIMGVIKNDSVITFGLGSIKDDITKNFKTIESLDLKVDSKNSIKLNIKEWEKVAVWCEENGENCYLVNKNGEIFVKNNLENIFLIKAISLIDEGEPIGQMVVEKEYLDIILNLNKELKEKGYIVESLNYLDKIQKDFEIFIRGIGFVAFRIDDNFKETINNFYAIIFNQDIEESYKNYNTSTTTLSIDFRYGNNVIYYKRPNSR